MTISKEELSGLVERVRGLKGADSEVDGEIHNAMFGTKYIRSTGSVTGFMTSRTDNGNPMVSPYTGSVDAALALVERVKPGWVIADLRQNSRHAGDPWGCTLAVYYGSQPSRNREVSSGYDYPSAPLAILLALLLSLQSQEPTP